MARPLTDIVGSRFGRLVVVGGAGRCPNGRAMWRCACDCGGHIDVPNGELRAGRRKGCKDCFAERISVPRGKGADCPNFKHGGASRNAHTKEYAAWASMIRRCTMPSQRSYKDYGGRGISVYPGWREDFTAFLAYVGAAPSARHTLDRHPNVNGNYEPGNVRWATTKAQANNTRANVRVAHGGKAMTVSEWADETGIKYQTLWARLFVRKWEPGRALSP